MYKISDFLKSLPSVSTKKTYRVAVTRYLEILSDTKIPLEQLDSAWETYLANADNLGEDLVRFAHNAKEMHNLSPKTIRLYGQIAVMYLKEAEISIPNKAVRTLRVQTPANRPISRESELDRTILQTLIQHADLRMKTEILIAVSSGMRIGEILGFSLQDISLNAVPAEIHLRSDITKNKTARTVFISREAAWELKLWLAHRETLISEGKIKPNDTRCFPYARSTEIAKFKRLLKDAALLETDEQTHRTTIHFHLFRKYFLTEFKLAASAEVAEELAGHTGYLSESYRRLTKKTMQEEYLKAEKYLTIKEPSAKSPDRKEQNINTPPLTLKQSGVILQIQQQLTELKSEIQALNSVLSQTLCDTKN